LVPRIGGTVAVKQVALLQNDSDSHIQGEAQSEYRIVRI
jgi:hypothetical protein